MPSNPLDNLARREREVIQALYLLGEASATDIQEQLGPSAKNAATRKILTALLEKGAIKRRREGKRYIYTPTQGAEEVGSSALAQVLNVFFMGAFANGSLGMVELGKDRFTNEELEQIRNIVKNEPAAKPCSDEKICKILSTSGIQVARRTVAKYREQMGIPPSSKRKSV